MQLMNSNNSLLTKCNTPHDSIFFSICFTLTFQGREWAHWYGGEAPPRRQDGVPLADGLRVQGDDSDRDPQHGHANRPARLCGLRQGLGQDSLISVIYPH